MKQHRGNWDNVTNKNSVTFDHKLRTGVSFAPISVNIITPSTDPDVNMPSKIIKIITLHIHA